MQIIWTAHVQSSTQEDLHSFRNHEYDSLWLLKSSSIIHGWEEKLDHNVRLKAFHSFHSSFIYIEAVRRLSVMYKWGRSQTNEPTFPRHDEKQLLIWNLEKQGEKQDVEIRKQILSYREST